MPETPLPTDTSSGEGAAAPTGKVRLVVLFGGQSAEHDVSCVSARHVIAAADPQKYVIEPVGIDRNGIWHRGERPLPAGAESIGADEQGIDELPEHLAVGGEAIDALPLIAAEAIADGSPIPTVVFPVLHGPMGEDGTVQGLLELANVAYVGAGVLASALCMDKVAAKAHLAASDIPQGDYTWLTVDGPRDADDAAVFPDGTSAGIDDAARKVADQLGLPLFVKPANMGSSVGVSRASTVEEAAAAIAFAADYDRIVIVEEEIRGREIEVAVLGNDTPVASVPGEIVPGAEFYDYADKYDAGAELRVPAPLGPDEVAEAQAMAVAAFKALRVEGLARVDFFYEDGLTAADGRQHGDRGWIINELNTMPGFTPISMYPKLWAETGLPYPELIDRLVELALGRHQRQLRHRRTDH